MYQKLIVELRGIPKGKEQINGTWVSYRKWKENIQILVEICSGRWRKIMLWGRQDIIVPMVCSNITNKFHFSCDIYFVRQTTFWPHSNFLDHLVQIFRLNDDIFTIHMVALGCCLIYELGYVAIVLSFINNLMILVEKYCK